MADYHLLTIWHVRAPRDRVWGVLSDPANYRRWWPAFRRYRDLTPGCQGVGQRDQRTMRGGLPLALRFTTEIVAVRPLQWMRYVAEGDLAGWGLVRLSDEPAGTRVVITWRVSTTHRWLKLFYPLLRKVLTVNHHAVMRQGQRGLARLLDTTGRTDAVSALVKLRRA